MTKKPTVNRKLKWKNITLNQSNIDEYLQDLYDDTAGNYITQGVSFNKDDAYQMTLLRNSLITHGSFSGFIKSLLHAHFEKNGKIDDAVWQPNRIVETEEMEDEPSSPPPSPPESDTPDTPDTPETTEPETTNVKDDGQKRPKRPSRPTPTQRTTPNRVGSVTDKERASMYSR